MDTRYLDINKKAWNKKTDIHVNSKFYDMEGFLKGNTSLKPIEIGLLGEVKHKRILHLQCHFGQDSISLSRMGAEVTGVDLSDHAIAKAKELAVQLNTSTHFICCNIYDLPQHLNETFDYVFTSYGTIGWLPDMDAWAKIIARFLNPGGKFIFVEFHPVVWMFDDDFTKVAYTYHNSGPIIETYTGTYADKGADLVQDYVMWNHGIGEVTNALISNGLTITSLTEYDYSPYDCLRHMEEYEAGKFRVKHLGNKIPYVYSITASK